MRERVAGGCPAACRPGLAEFVPHHEYIDLAVNEGCVERKVTHGEETVFLRKVWYLIYELFWLLTFDGRDQTQIINENREFYSRTPTRHQTG